MVVSSKPRPKWAKTESWKRYIKTSSRKLLKIELDESITEKGNVTFSDAPDSVVVLDVESDDENDNKQSRWYTNDDYTAFEKDRQLTALQYRTLKKQGTPYIEHEYSVRGLEDILDMDSSDKSHSDDEKRKCDRQAAISNHLNCVLQEQQRQRQAGCYPNPLMLREASLKSSRDARKRSAALGEADALGGYISSSKALQRHAAGVVHSISRKIHG